MEKKSGETKSKAKTAAKKTTAKTKVKRATKPKSETGALETSDSQARTPRRSAEKKGRVGGKICSISGCKREYRAKGYCATHYRKWRHGEYGQARYTACSDYGCFKPQGLNRHGFCEEHFQNYYVKGMEQAKIPAEKPAEKTAEKESAA